MSQILLASLGSGPLSPQTFTFVSNGDANGVCYFLGTNFRGQSWQNPDTFGTVVVTRSSALVGADGDLVNRAVEYNTTDNSSGEWIAIDLGIGNLMVVSDYLLRNGNDGGSGLAIRNWTLQGSNDVASNDVTGINAATWDDLDVRTSDTSMGGAQGDWIHKILGSTPAGYRWLRILNTGVNSVGQNYVQLCEFEFYGDFSF